jgi:ATP-dependent helicase/nuclease subunit B
METYQACPYSYFLKYDLRLNDKDTSKVEAVDTGTIMHDVIDKFFTRLDENKLTVSELSDEEIEKIILEIIDEVINLDRNYIFRSNEKYMHLVRRLKKVVLMSMKCIVRSIKYSSFEVFGHEVEFGENAKYKPIKLYTKSGELVEITGKIDRIDVAKLDDGKYVRIIDYKSSEKSVDLNKVKAGLQIQLLTYLNETCKQEDFIPAAALYFKLDDPINKSKISEEELEETIRKQFKMKGLILADVKVIKMMDNTLEDGKSSDMIPAGLTTKGEVSGSSTKSGISSASFKNLQKYMDKITTKISEEILSGKIDIKPVYYVSGKRTACEYCKYKSICNFDTELKGNKYTIIGKDKKDDVLEEIRSEVNS